jgi:hypothetical protein
MMMKQKYNNRIIRIIKMTSTLSAVKFGTI